jgi:hypothetical protein
MSVLVVLLLLIMPVLLYGVGWGVSRYTRKPPSWVGFPARPKEPSSKPDGEAPARIRAIKP